MIRKTNNMRRKEFLHWKNVCILLIYRSKGNQVTITLSQLTLSETEIFQNNESQVLLIWNDNKRILSENFWTNLGWFLRLP